MTAAVLATVLHSAELHVASLDKDPGSAMIGGRPWSRAHLIIHLHTACCRVASSAAGAASGTSNVSHHCRASRRGWTPLL